MFPTRACMSVGRLGVDLVSVLSVACMVVAYIVVSLLGVVQSFKCAHNSIVATTKPFAWSHSFLPLFVVIVAGLFAA